MTLTEKQPSAGQDRASRWRRALAQAREIVGDDVVYGLLEIVDSEHEMPSCGIDCQRCAETTTAVALADPDVSGVPDHGCIIRLGLASKCVLTRALAESLQMADEESDRTRGFARSWKRLAKGLRRIYPVCRPAGYTENARISR